VPFDKLGHRTDVPKHVVNENTERAMEAIPIALLGLAALLGGIYKLRTRTVHHESDAPRADG
jgi:hypothetical protein